MFRAWLVAMLLLVLGVGHMFFADEFTFAGTSVLLAESANGHCQLNLLALPSTLLSFSMISFLAENTGLSVRNALEQLQLTSRHVVYMVMAAAHVVPHVLNMAALINGIHGPGATRFCQLVSWGVFAPGVWCGCVAAVIATSITLQAFDQWFDLRCFRVLANLFFRNWSHLIEAQTANGDRTERWHVQGKYACFISHYKAEAATEARHLKDKLTSMLSSDVFLDSDDLADLRNLLDAVAASDVLVLLQTTNLLTRPWCLLEIYTAMRNQVPIVTVSVKGAFVYSYQDALEMLGTAIDPSQYSFADELNKRNPGAAMLIREQRIPVHGRLEDVDIAEMGRSLREHVPLIISKDFSPGASFRTIEAQLEDIVETMAEAVQAARPPSASALASITAL
jgi:hypothetical protein